MLGSQTAKKGEKSDCWAITLNTLSKNTNIIATTIPKARFAPVPPLLFTDDTEKAIIVKTKTEKGILHFLNFTTWYLPILEEPLNFSCLIKETSSGVQIESETRGRLVLSKSQLNAQQTHELSVKQIQPQMSTRKLPKSLAERIRRSGYNLRSKGKINNVDRLMLF